MYRVSVSQLKRGLDETLNRAAYGHERVLIVSKGKPKAVLISVEDYMRLESLEQGTSRQERRMAALQAARAVRNEIAVSGVKQTDSAELLEQIREERTDDILGLC